MLSRLEKYHKTFLVFVTAIIAVSFGLGSAFLTLFARGNVQAAGFFDNGKVKITMNDFRQALIHWRTFFELAEYVSVKAKKIQHVKPDAKQQSYFYLFHASTTTPVWDAIYSLREDVFKLDLEFDKRFEGRVNEQKWKYLLDGKLNFVIFRDELNSPGIYPPRSEEIQFYMGLKQETRSKIMQRLPKSDVWNFLMLLEEAKKWKVNVTEQEVSQFIARTKSHFSTQAEYQRYLNNLKMFPSAFRRVVKDALLILKFLKLKNSGLKISVKRAYDVYAQYHTKYKVNWIQLSDKKEKAGVDYTKQRVEFYNSKKKIDPDYFTISGRADFDYLTVNANDFLNMVEVTQQEINDVFDSQQKDSKEKLPVAIENEKKQKIAKQLRLEKANKKAYDLFDNIYRKLSHLKNKAPLKDIAENYDLVYKYEQNISKENFLSYTKSADAQEYIYDKLAIGELSPVITLDDPNNKKYFIFRVLQRESGKKLSLKDIKKDDKLFLKRYFERNKSKFEIPQQYRLAYVFADYSEIKQNLIVTSKSMQDFYNKYKKYLYKIDTKGKEEKYQPFENVKADIEKRVANLTVIQELQKLQAIHNFCKKKGKDINLKPVVDEMARRIMLVPKAIKYIAKPEFLTQEELEKNNPINPDIKFEKLEPDSEISDIKECSTGKYFYKVLDYKSKRTPKFAEIYDKVKTDFLMSQSIEAKRANLTKLAAQYKKQYKEAKDSIEQQYGKLITSIWEKGKQANIKEEEKLRLQKQEKKVKTDKKEKLNKLAVKVFENLAFVDNKKICKSEVFQKISNVKELKDIPLADSVLELKVGELSFPLVDRKSGSVFLIQLVKKEIPAIDEVPKAVLNRIRKILWTRAYHSRLFSFLNHTSLRKRMNLTITDENAVDYDFYELNEKDKDKDKS